MTLPENIDITALLAEKCHRSGVNWLQKLGHRKESEAITYLSYLQNRYRSFYTSLSKDEVMDRLNELVYWLSAEGSHIMGIGLYKELKGTSLEAAYNKQKEIMAMFATTRLKENFLLQLKQRAATANSGANIDKLANEMNPPQQSAKKYLLLLILLSVAAGFFLYSSIDTRRSNNSHSATQYMLMAVFCIMALVMLILFRVYKAYVKRRIDRGEVIRKG